MDFRAIRVAIVWDRICCWLHRMVALIVVSGLRAQIGYASHTHRLTTLFSGLPRWAGTRKVKPIWILLKQETVSGSGISWAICKSAPCSRQTPTLAPHHSVFADQMPFLPPNQQCQSIEGNRLHWRTNRIPAMKSMTFKTNWTNLPLEHTTFKSLFSYLQLFYLHPWVYSEKKSFYYFQ